MKVILILWASIMTVALVCSLVIWHPWNPPQAPKTDEAVLEDQYKLGYKLGYQEGYDRGSLSEVIASRESLLNSKVVRQVSIHVGFVLKGTLTQVSVGDQTIVLQAEGENGTVYLAEDTEISKWLEGGERKEIDMTELASYVGEQITVLAELRGDRFESNNINLGKIEITLK